MAVHAELAVVVGVHGAEPLVPLLHRRHLRGARGAKRCGRPAMARRRLLAQSMASVVAAEAVVVVAVGVGDKSLPGPLVQKAERKY